MISELCQKAYGIIHDAKMAEDVEDIWADRFDLSALKVDLWSEAPERDAD